MDDKHTIDFRYSPSSSWTSFCRPDDPHKSIVREDGALLYGFHADNFEAWHFKRVIEFGIQAAHGPHKITQRTESARAPIVITTLEYPRATLTLTTFAAVHHDALRTDVVLWHIRAHEDVDEFLTGLHIDVYDQRRVFVGRGTGRTRHVFAVAPDTLPPPNRWDVRSQYLPDDESLPPRGDLAFISSPHYLKKFHTTGFRPASGLASEPMILRAGEAMRGAIIVPQNHQQTDKLDFAWAEAALVQERHFWNTLPLPALPIEVPDPAVMEMLISCARNILQAREFDNGLPIFKVGPTVYRNLFVVDGHFMLEAARILGYGDDATAAIDTLLRRVRPNGAIAEMLHHSKETGISVATLIRQCELLGDDERLRGLWPTIRNAIAYIEGLREEARALPPDDLCHNLLPRTFGDGGVGGDRGEYTTALWILFGLKSAAGAARRLGYGDDATRFQADFDSLMADFRAHTARTMRTLPDGTPYVPMWFPEGDDHHWVPNFPLEVAPWHHLQPESGTWAFCQAIWPGEVFAPDDPLVQNLLRLHDLRDDEQGIPATTGWLPYKALWSYHASFAAHAWLYAGRPDKAIDYLYAFANHASPTRVWREEQSLTSTGNGQIFGDMPHNWASVEFIRLVRDLLVFERGQTLELLPGLPAHWKGPGKRIYLERTPTRFGPVTLEVNYTADETRITLQMDAAWPAKPSQVKVHLFGATRVTINGQAAKVAADSTVTFEAAAQTVLDVSY